jgi:hypothetical protein
VSFWFLVFQRQITFYRLDRNQQNIFDQKRPKLAKFENFRAYGASHSPIPKDKNSSRHGQKMYK